MTYQENKVNKMLRYKIIKIDAKKLIQYCEIKEEEIKTEGKFTPRFKFDITNAPMYTQVVQEVSTMDNCALYEQLLKVLKVNMSEADVKDKKVVVINSLMYTFVTLDFSGIYNLTEKKKDNEFSKRGYYLEKTELLIKEGFLLKTENFCVHMMAFDKNDNMSRECKITYLDYSKMQEINERLTVGICFDRIKLPLSKYYAYRGLYLSTSNSVSVPLTEVTVVVVKDKLTRYDVYQKETDLLTADVCGETQEGRVKYSFYTKEKVSEKIPKPYDGQGFISPEYAQLINDELGLDGASSFQIRMPFAKGMLHKVDFHQFFEEFDADYARNDTYMMKDCFGRERDLKKAHIIMTESMFKCSKWVHASVQEGEDPMKFYFEQLKKYEHKLFVANTDLPYGKKKVVRLSYQMLNTLALSGEQFDTVVEQHLDYMHNPIEYLKISENYNSDEEMDNQVPVWKRALFRYPEVAGCDYIKEQLKNTQRSLLGQLPEGKITISGQMRYLARDLPYMLVRLVRSHDVREEMKKFKFFDYRFYMPQGNDENANPLDLCFEKWYGFLRSPHLSRNEQCLLKPFIPSSNKETIEDTDHYDAQKVRNDYRLLTKYFGHLTGVVMVGNEALVPLALGGADFDGDLVEVIFDETVNSAIKEAVYQSDGKYNLRRKLPYVKVPDNNADEVSVVENIPFEIINNTFSNKIGLISNAAIRIGQIEYGSNESIFVDDEMTCAKCTILTGLEIDAAKHGKHPDLSEIEEIKNDTPFLIFKTKYDKMKKGKRFFLNCLEVKAGKNLLGEPEWQLTLTNQAATIHYPIEVGGTHINKLPLVFIDNLDFEPFKAGRKEIGALLRPRKEERQNPVYQFVEEQIKNHMISYDIIISFYDNIDKYMKAHIQCVDNMTYILTQMYDDDYIGAIIEEKLPQVENVLKDIIRTEAERKAVSRRINEARWHLQPADNKKECLRKEILNTDQDLDDLVWDFLYQQHCQGYKILWYIIESLKIDYQIKELLEELKKLKETEQIFINYISNLGIEGIKNEWNESGKSEGKDQALFYVSQKVRDIDADVSLKIKVLFKLTKGVVQRRLFWNCFSWTDMKSVMDEARKEVDIC